jgi:hypothetical protein
VRVTDTALPTSQQVMDLQAFINPSQAVPVLLDGYAIQPWT